MIACGDNEQGQLGNGTNLASQEMIEIPTEQSFEQLAAGAWHCLALSEGKVYGWGKTTQGQLGSRPGKGDPKQQKVPKQITSLPAGVKSIAAGSLFSLALL
jgi:alpha-tubulin suppressor-like RCC1 family protein